MKCQVDGCQNAATEFSGPRKTALCRAHKYPDTPVQPQAVPTPVPRYIPCAKCGLPTNQLAPSGDQSMPVVTHAKCPATTKRKLPAANKSKRPGENK